MPDGVLAPERRRRTYRNAVLARAEVTSDYVPARRLWVRELRGAYLPNPALAIREVDEHGDETWRPIQQHLGQNLLDRHVDESFRWRPRNPAPELDPA